MSVHIETIKGVAFLAYPETLAFLKSELKNRFKLDDSVHLKCYGDILYLENIEGIFSSSNPEEIAPQELPYWARTTFLKPFILHFDSIGEAASALKEIQRNWAPYQYQNFRRAALIQDKLPYINLKVRKFPVEIPKSPIGVYTLIDDKTILASALTSSYIPAGRIELRIMKILQVVPILKSRKV